MNRILKKFTIILLALAAVACICVGAACADNSQETNGVTVTLVAEDGTKNDFLRLPGDPLPTVSVADKDFEGYWTDAAFTVFYESTVTPEENITLYYKLNVQYYSLAIDYGAAENGGVVDMGEIARGESVELPTRSPSGTELAGYSKKPGTAAEFPAGESVSNLGEKGEKVTLYPVWTAKDDADFVVEDGVVVSYTGSETDVTLPLTASSVAAEAFADNSYSANITSLTVPECYSSLERGALAGLTGLKTLTVPFIGGSRSQNRFLAYVFGAERYTDNVYSFSLYSDGDNVQNSNFDFSSLYIPRTLTTVRVTDSVRDIAEGAFYYAYSLENLVLDHPENLRKVGDSAFEACYYFGYDTSLGTAVCPTWLRYVSVIGDRAFKSYTGDTESDITSIRVDGVQYDLVTYETPLNNFTYIPKLENIVSIGDDAFYYCALISSLEFGDKLESIGLQSFMFTITLTNVRFPDSLREVGDFAFNGSGVTAIEFGDGIRSIGTMAFAQCTGLSEVIFTGNNVPVLIGRQSFNNNVSESVSGAWNIVLNDDFQISVKESMAASFRTAPDWVEYLGHINAADTESQALAVAYMSVYGTSDWDVRFEFLPGNTVFVYDPSLAFIDNIDISGSYSQTSGTKYPLRYSVLDAEDYAEVAGEDAKPLYDNQVAVSMWHPLISTGGSMAVYYFVITELPYGTGDGAVLLPVAKNAGRPASNYGSSKEGTFNITVNTFGVPELYKITDGDRVAEADPAGTHYAELRSDTSATSYTIVYYNDKFEVIEQRKFLCDSASGSATASIYEISDEEHVVLTGSYYNDDYLFLKGNGTAEIYFGGVTYTASASAVGGRAYGEDGYTVNFSNFMQGGSAVGGLAGSAVFSDFDGSDYARIDLTVGEESSMILNTQDMTEWDVTFYNRLASAPVINFPTFSSVGNAWRYLKLSTPTVLASVNLYTYNGKTYYRQLGGDGSVTAFGSATVGGDGITLQPAAGAAVSGTINADGDLVLGGVTYTYYDYFTDMTITLRYEDIYTSEYYYTVKSDGYGNIWVLDESYYSTNGQRYYYVGTYETGTPMTEGGADYRMLVATVSQCTSSGYPMPGAEKGVLWFVYDGLSIAPRTGSGESPWESTLTGIYSPSEGTKIEVVDAYGCKVFDIAIDIYGNPSHVEYSYTLDAEGNPVYTETESDVQYFVPVTDDAGNISYCVAVGSDGIAMFIVRPVPADDGDETDPSAPLVFEIEPISGIMVTYGETVVHPDVAALESIDAGTTFGSI